ncbi:hypothetical protein [Microbulbifer epialgicus]|uniref:Phage integrase family protein n=1 Tax=Microbulbifer epialgicus TaxID=393907 RepID=A0ABV4NTU4_9GAMM
MPLVNDGITVSKIDATKSDYLVRAKQLLQRFQSSQKVHKSSLPDFVDWLISLKPEISSSTWRQYKASTIWFLELKKEVELLEILKNISSDGCRDIREVPIQKRNTSSRKKKSVTEREEEMIVKYLSSTASTSFWAKPTLSLFKAILATGLRPEELKNSFLINENESQGNYEFKALPVLKVKNAKHTNGRSHGEFRHLLLNHLDEIDLLYIRIALQYANPHSPQGWSKPSGKKATNWHEYYTHLRGHFYRVTSKIFPTASRRVTFYSCRHQFIANLKKAKYSRDEIAAIVGHATDDTATVHYGRAKFGRTRKGLPGALPDEVNRIRQVYQDPPSLGSSAALNRNKERLRH